eukprot:scaffold163046_cov46-Prasinocladus_malaysianus.AAC.2
MHVAGATHRKAVDKQEADRQRALRGGAAAEAALHISLVIYAYRDSAPFTDASWIAGVHDMILH